MIFDKHANLKYKYGNRHFWAEGYYVSTVELNEATIQKYIQDQDKHDIALDKLSVKEYTNYTTCLQSLDFTRSAGFKTYTCACTKATPYLHQIPGTPGT